MHRDEKDSSGIGRIGLVCLLVGSAVACGDGASGPLVVNPQPIPVTSPVFALRPSDMHVVRSGSETELRGSPGAAEPAEALLRGFALDAPGVSAETTVDANKGFALSFASSRTTKFHLELEADDEISTPVDVEEDSQGKLSKLPSAKCLSNDVSSAVIEQGPLGEPTTFVVKLHETCGATQALHVALFDAAHFALHGAPTSIGPHQTLTLSVVHPAAKVAGEDVDLLLVNDASPGLMVVSLHAVTP
jgi:hypothetical protein